MRQRGRKSALKNLDAFPIDGGPSRLEPPAFLSIPERTLFCELTAACDARHFRLSDQPLLAAYCQAAILARSAIGDAAADPAALVTWEKATRMLATLATRLRLAPQARIDARAAGRYELPRGPKPWKGKV